MIRSIHKLIVPSSERDYHALEDFFEQLGLTKGESWKGTRSRGAKFHAPDAGVEVGFGQGFPAADLVIEADSADEVYEAVRKRGAQILEDIADTDWGARMFTMAAPGGLRIALFSYVREPESRRGIEGKLTAEGLRIGIVVSRFNAFITERLLAGALDALRRAGARDQDIQIARVPGSFEIPAGTRTLAETREYDAIVCLGCLLRGETAHYEVIANEVARGVGQSAQETGVPHAFGVLTCDTLEQALDRAGLKMGNKGFEAALAAVEMANLRRAASRQPSALSRKS